jgi:DNA topoisomerase-6 subunit A
MLNPTDALETLTVLGKKVVNAIANNEFPSLEIPDRSTDNIVYDQKNGQFIPSESTITRDSSNVRHVKSFAQLMWIASYAKTLLESGRTSSLRDIYYSSEAYDVHFKNQAKSDRIITDLECLTGLAREDFGIYPEERSSVYGEAKMRYTVTGYEGREVDLTISPDGLPIGCALMTADPIESKAEKILAIESGGMFSRLIETGAWKKFNTILVHLGGQPPRATRRFMRKLWEHLNLPVYIFTDGDPWGMHIARVIMTGSANAAHIAGLVVNDAKWIGVTPEDIESYSLPSDPMTNADLRRLDQLAKDVRYTGREWQEYIEAFRNLRCKAEQQAFSRYGMDYVVNSYLPDKLC